MPKKRSIEERKARYLASSLVKRALIAKTIRKPNKCSDCGSKYNLEAHHHNGYENPLDIVWLCRRCHGKRHGIKYNITILSAHKPHKPHLPKPAKLPAFQRRHMTNEDFLARLHSFPE